MDDQNTDICSNSNGFQNGNSTKGINGHQNKSDETSMMEVILKTPTVDPKQPNGHYGSNTNISAPAGGLPGVRGRTRQSVNGRKKKKFKFYGDKYHS